MNKQIENIRLTPNTKWDLLCRPPESALKAITGGRLKGMTDVNPQWRYKAMHDVFGPIGSGWRYQVDRVWTENGSDGQIFMFAQVSVFVRSGETWSDPIPGVGGSMLIEKDKYGLHNNDEAPKMAITDALSVALKMLGVASDIYMGRWDGSKYKDDDKAYLAEYQAAAAKGTEELRKHHSKHGKDAGKDFWDEYADQLKATAKAADAELATTP